MIGVQVTVFYMKFTHALMKYAGTVQGQCRDSAGTAQPSADLRTARNNCIRRPFYSVETGGCGYRAAATSKRAK